MLANITFPYSRFALNGCALAGRTATAWRMKMDKKTSRQRIRRIQVLLLPAEAAAIKSHATNCSLSASAYLRNLGLHYRPKSNVDADAVMEMIKSNGDQGRLGGLLKMWLTNDERLKLLGKEQIVPKINKLLDEIQATQALLFEKVKKL